MTDAAKAMSAIRRIDEYSCRKTVLSRISPLSHLTVTLGFIIAVLSAGRYEPATLAVFTVYPVIIPILCDIPFGVILKRILIALPVAVLPGVFNPLLDKNRILLGGIAISAGWLSLLCLVLKCALTVSSALILICVVGADGVCVSLQKLKVPNLIVAQLSFTYRYIHVLGGEIVHVLTAYRLRSPASRGISLTQFGSLCGGLFLRSAQHAENIYAAMRCRGFDGTFPASATNRVTVCDCCYMLVWILFFVFARLFNLPEAIGNFLLGL